MSKIKNKIGELSHRMPANQSQPRDLKTSDNDAPTKNIRWVAKVKPLLNPSTFFLFPMEMNFAPLVPETITRRFGKMHSHPLFIRHERQQIEEFQKLVFKDERLKQSRKQRQHGASLVVPELGSEDDSDDIFGGDDDEEEQEPQMMEDEAMPVEGRKGPSIRVGSKLSFGVSDADIFGGQRYNKAQVQPQQQQPVFVEKDKYEFLQKKVKPNKEQKQGYEECYVDNGTSLDEMCQLKKAGIQLFGDAKEYVQKERKYNVSQDYEKIKRIIEEKSNK